jgi:8-oxo-dGTP pyrophosphatase MutT (NUDIX family)
VIYLLRVVSAAAALIFDTNGRVLLMREGYGRKRYGLPGGVIEEGETPRAAAVREVKEELGLDVEATELVAVYHLRTQRSEGLRFFFRCEILHGEPAIPDTGEVTDFLWSSPTALPSPTTTTAPFAIRDGSAGHTCVYREIDTRNQAEAAILA